MKEIYHIFMPFTKPLQCKYLYCRVCGNLATNYYYVNGQKFHYEDSTYFKKTEDVVVAFCDGCNKMIFRDRK